MKLNSILFIHIPRTGGTHLEKLLGFKGHDSPPRCGSAGYGANYEEIMGWDQRTGKMLQHLSYRELVELNFICPDNDLFKLAIIRNPYQRAVSLYKYFGGSFKWGDYLSFLQHLQGNLAEEYFYRSQYEYVFYLGTNQMNEIIRFENYVKDLARIKESKKLNIEVKFDTSRQSKQEQDYFNLYYHNNPAAIEAVNKIYEKDFEHFGYKKAGDDQNGIQSHSNNHYSSGFDQKEIREIWSEQIIISISTIKKKYFKFIPEYLRLMESTFSNYKKLNERFA